MRSWQGQFEMDGRLQLEQSAAVSRAVPAEQTEQGATGGGRVTAPSCAAMPSQRQHERYRMSRPCAGLVLRAGPRRRAKAGTMDDGRWLMDECGR